MFSFLLFGLPSVELQLPWILVYGMDTGAALFTQSAKYIQSCCSNCQFVAVENIFEDFCLDLPSWHWPLLYELGCLKRPDFHKKHTLHLLKSVCSPSAFVILATKNADSKEVLF